MPRNIENRIYTLTAPDASDIECTCRVRGVVVHAVASSLTGDRSARSR